MTTTPGKLRDEAPRRASGATRRQFLTGAAATLAAACHKPEPAMIDSAPTPKPSTMPVVFVSHGAPTLALDAVRGADFRHLAQALPQPRAVLTVSAHWLDAPATIGTRQTRALMYDFGGFDDALYRVRYAAPAAAALADDLQRRLPELRVAEQRAWDHGVWVPLVHMYPRADVPVLQVSLPYAWSPERLFEFGQRLAPLRQDGVLLLGSGGAVHNLHRIDWRDDAATPTWASEFEAWVRERLSAGQTDELVAFRAKAPAVRLAHPTDEHFLPLLVALGAAQGSAASFPIQGFEMGSLSRLAVRFG